jgi:hypothetical protein
MSKARLSRVSSNGTYLNDCLQAQHYYLSLEIDDPQGKILCRMSMSYDQFVQILTDACNTTVTLERYRDCEGNLIVEEVKKPESVRDRMIDRMGEVHESLSNRIKDLRKDLYEALNEGKAGKKTLEQLLHSARVIEDNFESNAVFTVQQASEEIKSMQECAKSQLAIFLSEHGVNNVDISPMLQQSDQKALPAPDQLPVIEKYELKERVSKPIDDMTALEVADAMTIQLKRIERLIKQEHDGHAVLFWSGASVSKNGVSIRYISYQGTTRVELDEAKDYLKFLKTVTDISKFKAHWHYKNVDNEKVDAMAN